MKIGDFGISKRLEDETAKSTLLKRAPGLIAPELYGFTPPGTPFAADLWSLDEDLLSITDKETSLRKHGPLGSLCYAGLSSFPLPRLICP